MTRDEHIAAAFLLGALIMLAGSLLVAVAPVLWVAGMAVGTCVILKWCYGSLLSDPAKGQKRK